MNVTITLVQLELALLITLIDNQLKKESDEEMIELLIHTKQKIKLSIYQDAVKNP